MATIVAIDDELCILEFLRQAFPEPEYAFFGAVSLREGLSLIEEKQPDVVLLDLDLPDGSGLEGFRRIREWNLKTPTIFMTGHGTTNTAIEAMSLGAYEYLLKPLEFDPLKVLVDRAIADARVMRSRSRLDGEPPGDDTDDALVGRSPAMQEVYKLVGRIAPKDVAVLILGESGTGKELIARAIYHYSRRAQGPFLAINCAAIPETLLESELFGHEKGAFTGADHKRIGKFEQCSGGTIFLDEIGDMPPLTQAKVLRLLETRSFERVGGNQTIRADVRLIAATNRDLKAMIDANKFRIDLYYRLNGFTIRLPPLRERGDDLDLLIQHFLKRLNKELGTDVRGVTPDALDLLKNYRWPGNVRELQNVLRQALLQATAPLLQRESFLPYLQESTRSRSAERHFDSEELERFVRAGIEAGSARLYHEWLAKNEPALLLAVLRQVEGNLSQAARCLGIDRATLRSKMRSYGLRPDRAPIEHSRNTPATN
ncbi:MAG: sigma-54-dependent Fis family transcriptional regulator [Gemmatales bacterium]|nr:MAG: sigma-54-dependent Fis family transcriptional regulator [Gemmatales bacterium]